MNFLFQRGFAALVRWVSFFIYDISVSMIPNDKNGRKKKNTKKTKKKKNNYFFFNGLFSCLRRLFFSELDQFTSNGRVKNKECGAGAIWSGNTEELAFFPFSFYFPFHITAMDSFSFFFFLFSLFTFFFIHSSLLFNSCIGRVQLIYTFTFFIFAIQFGLFFFSLALLHIIILVVVAFCLFFLAIFASFYFFPGIISITKTKNWRAQAIWCFLNLFYFCFIHIITHSSVHCACLFFCVPSFSFFALRPPYLPLTYLLVLLWEEKKK